MKKGSKGKGTAREWERRWEWVRVTRERGMGKEMGEDEGEEGEESGKGDGSG